MGKRIKTTNTELGIVTSKIDVVEIADFSFEKDERYPWIDLYSVGNEGKELIEQIDKDINIEIASIEDLKIFALNWFFNNVEISRNLGDD